MGLRPALDVVMSGMNPHLEAMLLAGGVGAAGKRFRAKCSTGRTTRRAAHRPPPGHSLEKNAMVAFVH